MTKLPIAKAAAAPAVKKKAAPKPLDTGRLKDLAAEIEALQRNGQRLTDLQARLSIEQGLKIDFQSGAYVARMAGVRASSTESERAALRNWANAARRALLQAGER